MKATAYCQVSSNLSLAFDMRTSDSSSAAARAFATQNLDAFPTDVDAIITNAAGCGSGMHEYHLILKGITRGSIGRAAPAWSNMGRNDGITEVIMIARTATASSTTMAG